MHSNPDPERSFGSISFPIRGSPLFRFPLFDEMKFFLSLSLETRATTYRALNGMENKSEGTEISRYLFSMPLFSS